MHAKHALYIRPLLRIENVNPLITNLSRLLKKNLGSVKRVSIVYVCRAEGELGALSPNFHNILILFRLHSCFFRFLGCSCECMCSTVCMPPTSLLIRHSFIEVSLVYQAHSKVLFHRRTVSACMPVYQV